MIERSRACERRRLAGPTAATGERPAAPPGAIGWTRRSLIFSKNGPCEVHSGCHSPGVACTAAVIPDQIRAGHQSQDRQGARPHCPAGEIL